MPRLSAARGHRRLVLRAQPLHAPGFVAFFAVFLAEAFRVALFAGGKSRSSVGEWFRNDDTCPEPNERSCRTTEWNATFTRPPQSYSPQRRIEHQRRPNDGGHDPSSEPFGVALWCATCREAVPERAPVGTTPRPVTAEGLIAELAQRPKGIERFVGESTVRLPNGQRPMRRRGQHLMRLRSS